MHYSSTQVALDSIPIVAKRTTRRTSTIVNSVPEKESKAKSIELEPEKVRAVTAKDRAVTSIARAQSKQKAPIEIAQYNNDVKINSTQYDPRRQSNAAFIASDATPGVTTRSRGSTRLEGRAALARYNKKILGLDMRPEEEDIGKLFLTNEVDASRSDLVQEHQIALEVQQSLFEMIDLVEERAERASARESEEHQHEGDDAAERVESKRVLDEITSWIETRNENEQSESEESASREWKHFQLQLRIEEERIARESNVPTVNELYSGGFGMPSKKHSFRQVGAFETTLFQLLKSEYVGGVDLTNLHACHPLIAHLHKMMQYYATVDFTPLREYDENYARQKEIPKERVKMFMACLFHFDLSVANVMRYVGNNYTAGYRDVYKMVDRMRGLVDEDLLDHFVRVMLVGAPAHFNAETSRENFLLHWREGNHPSVDLQPELMQKAMNKMEKNQFVYPIKSYMARFIPNIFLTPMHLLQRPGKDNRIIYDASRRFTPYSTPVNMMTSTPLGVELDCEYGAVFKRLCTRIWNLRISYPDSDIILHANDVKSCFRQLKHHPDVMGAFSYIVGDLLYLSCGLTMGADFSPPTWEGPRRIAEQLATNLFGTPGLVEKHREHLDKLQWSKKLSSKVKGIVRAHKSTTHQGAIDEKTGKPVNTPHHLFVDDDVYAEVFDRERVEETIACGIESLFMILGESDLAKRQDPVSWDKLEEMTIHFRNVILGQDVNTRDMRAGATPEFISKVVVLLNTTWRDGSHEERRKSFTLKEAETLAGQLNHISNSCMWLKHLMSHVYTSMAAAMKQNLAFLTCTNKHFRAQIKQAKLAVVDEKSRLEATFAQAETSRRVHNLKKKYFINETLREELNIIRRALESEQVLKTTPLAHLIDNDPDSEADGDSSLDAAGGWSTSMQLWWYIEWPEHIKQRTLRFVKDGKSGTLIDINALEYATLIIGYAASTYYWVIEDNRSKLGIPYPRSLIRADNKVAGFWAVKGCKRSFVGRSLGRLQSAMMINNPVGLDNSFVDTKTNVIADRISRFKSEANSQREFELLTQEYPQLRCCRRFRPSQELISLILDALLLGKLVDPLEASRVVQSNPGKVTS